MKLVEFSPEHITAIDGQEAQDYEATIQPRTFEYGKYLQDSGVALTAVHDGVVVACLGCVEIWPRRYMVWSVLSKEAGRHMLALTRSVRRLAGMYEGSGRFELIVRAGFDNGCRWADMLGFKYNNYEKQFLPDGSDAHTYVRFI